MVKSKSVSGIVGILSEKEADEWNKRIRKASVEAKEGKRQK